MSTDRETTRIVQSWLQEGVTALPDPVLDAVLDQLPATRQRRATWWRARRTTHMNTMAKYGLAAAAVLAAAFISFNFLVSPNVGGPALEGTPEPTPSAAPTTAAVPVLRSAAVLDAGTYQARAFIPITVLVTLPEGWGGGGDWVIIGPDGRMAPGGMAIRFASVENLFADPLSREAGLLEPPVGPTVDDLVTAMTTHPDWMTSAPTDITVDGYEGQRVRLTIPQDVELADGQFLLFRDEMAGDHWGYEAGQIFDFYVVDVEGERLVLEVISYPGTPAEDFAEQQAIIDSLQLEP